MKISASAIPGIPFAAARALGSDLVRELMRHSDIKTTLRHYADVSQSPLAAAVAKLSALTVPSPAKDSESSGLAAVS